MPVAASIIKGVANNSVCIDVPVNLNNEKVFFNLDSAVTTDGTAAGAPVGIRHMWMLANANAFRITKLGLDPAGYSMIGLFHGDAATWALSNAWWIANVPGATGNPYGPWIDKLLAMKSTGISIQLELCGTTMFGKGWTNADVYPGIIVNQGAIGRIIDLQINQGYAYVQEGYVDPLTFKVKN